MAAASAAESSNLKPQTSKESALRKKTLKPLPSNILPPARPIPSKPTEIVSPTGDQVFRCLRIWGKSLSHHRQQRGRGRKPLVGKASLIFRLSFQCLPAQLRTFSLSKCLGKLGIIFAFQVICGNANLGTAPEDLSICS